MVHLRSGFDENFSPQLEVSTYTKKMKKKITTAKSLKWLVGHYWRVGSQVKCVLPQKPYRSSSELLPYNWHVVSQLICRTSLELLNHSWILTPQVTWCPITYVPLTLTSHPTNEVSSHSLTCLTTDRSFTTYLSCLDWRIVPQLTFTSCSHTVTPVESTVPEMSTLSAPSKSVGGGGNDFYHSITLHLMFQYTLSRHARGEAPESYSILKLW